MERTSATVEWFRKAAIDVSSPAEAPEFKMDKSMAEVAQPASATRPTPGRPAAPTNGLSLKANPPRTIKVHQRNSKPKAIGIHPAIEAGYESNSPRAPDLRPQRRRLLSLIDSELPASTFNFNFNSNGTNHEHSITTRDPITCSRHASHPTCEMR